MRLLNVTSLEFDEFRDDQRPKYVIASHRWVEGGEVTLQDVQKERNIDKSGYKKIVQFARYVKEHVPAVDWLWVDTCCINKKSAAELSKALNLMFDWYQNAVLCVAYLADVEAAGDKDAFRRSEWFLRGWTLQELLAPRLIVFVTKSWQVIGNKGASTYISCETPHGLGLEEDIAAITGIPKRILHNYAASSSVSVKERLRWIEGRTTTEPEDMFYSLYGIFGVTPGANYGEGHERAKQRLLAAIHQEENLTAQQADHFQKIVAWLSPPDPWTNHASARSLHEPKTGAWLLESGQYRRWKSGATRHLWMYGKAGCGKTILCSTAVEDVKEHCQHRPNAGYAVFYFSFSEERKQRLVDLLCSFVAQLGWKGPALSLLQQMYDKPNRSQPGLEELEKILFLCFEPYNEVFLLIDALDECPDSGDVRLNMLECLARMSQRAPCVKILATSRELPDIRMSIAALGSEEVLLATRAVDADIRQYVARCLARDQRLCRLDSKTKTLIEETISANADGMFRWAYCQVQELKKLKVTRPSVIKKALYSLPKTLDETYERMLVEIEPETRTDALKLLRWLAYAKSPPSLGELVDVSVIDLTAEGSVETEDLPGFDDPLQILSGLVIAVGVDRDSNEPYEEEDAETVGREDDNNKIEFARHRPQTDKNTRIRLAHFSVKEYLESRRILESSAKDFYLESSRDHRILSQSCLIYLTHYNSSEEKLSTHQDLSAFPLLQYAAESWFYHATLQDAVTATREITFLCAETTLRDWLRVHQPDKPWEHSFCEPDNIGSSLYYASFIGLERVVEELVIARAEVNAQGGRYGSALQAASAGGHEKVVQMLMDAGAEVNAQGGVDGSALQAASAGGHEKVVQMLMDAGAHAEAKHAANSIWSS